MILTCAHGFIFKTALNISHMCELKIYGPMKPHWVDRVRHRMPFNSKHWPYGEASRSFYSFYTAPWLKSKYNMNHIEMSLNIPLLTDGWRKLTNHSFYAQTNFSSHNACNLLWRVYVTSCHAIFLRNNKYYIIFSFPLFSK